eukprot:51931_1
MNSTQTFVFVVLTSIVIFVAIYSYLHYAVILVAICLLMYRYNLFSTTIQSKWKKIDFFSNEFIDNLKYGCNLVHQKQKKYIIYKNNDGSLIISRNKCNHQGGIFVEDIEDSNILKCSRHGWKLNPKNMKYVNPCNEIQQQYRIVSEQNGYSIYDLIELQSICKPWLPLRMKQKLDANELTLTFYSHACMKIKCGDFIIFTDPWLMGPAFMKGWWLLFEPPKNWLHDLSKADLIYISHNHSDHLNIPTLQELSKNYSNNNIKIIVGDLKVPIFDNYCLKQTNINRKNINTVPLGIWKDINKDLRIMILPDGLWQDIDTCLLIDYKGWLVLFSVDCVRPNNFNLPITDVMLSSFARGASGFPSTHYGGKYTNKWKINFVNQDKKKMLLGVKDILKITKSKIYIPYAGYFIEAESKFIQTFNQHNTFNDVFKHVQSWNKDVFVWKPLPGKILDISNKKTIDSYCEKKYIKEKWDIDTYKNEIYQYVNFECFNSINGLDSDEVHVINSFYVDYNNITVSYDKPKRNSKYFMETKVDIGCFRKTLYEGLNWDGLYIGFQMRVNRIPDIYHKKFWQHFYTQLPDVKPNLN